MLIYILACYIKYTNLGSKSTSSLERTKAKRIQDKARNALALALSPVVKALVNPDGAMIDIRNLDSVR